MITREQAFAAKRLVDDETFTQAIGVVQARANKDLLTAKTPEEREQKFQEYDALRRVVSFLEKQAHEVKNFTAEN